MTHNNTNVALGQEKKIKEVGIRLQQLRIERGLTLEAIAKQTLIPLRILKAIEAGRKEELPEPFYTKALVQKFARALKASETEVTAWLGLLSNPPPQKVEAKRLCFPRFQLRSIHLYLLYIVLVGMSVKGITNLVESPSVKSNLTETEAIDPVPDSVSISNSEPIAKQSTPTPQLISSQVIPSCDGGSCDLVAQSRTSPVVVDIDLKERCWLKVMVDGKTEFEGTLPQGTHRTWVGKEQITVRAGNAGGVSITFNDEQKQILGEPGQVQEVTYTLN